MTGIDKINYYTPNTYVDLVELAEARGIDPDKFTIGIGQSKMAVPTLTQDAVAMAANAALPLLTENERETIDMVIVGTESGIDQSKSIATFVHQLLDIHPFAKAIEIKQACYGATAGLMMARDYVSQHPNRKALVIATDIAKYGLATGGEVTQGAGAVAMIVASEPRILELHDDNVAMSDNIFDFWRPNYSEMAFVDGKFSNEAYMTFFEKIWTEYTKRTTHSFENFAALCFHLPYTKMGKKALLPLLDTQEDAIKTRLLARYDESTAYTREIGNIYTGSLYLSLLALLNRSNALTSGDIIGLFSYGSGAVGEFFTGTLVAGYEKQLRQNENEALLENRTKLTINQYESIFKQSLPKNGSNVTLKQDLDNGHFYLSQITNHMRQYSHNK
ncbi:hydroxymethylglutaryl-CoA synthase [Vagococcus silagei]|uniref:Hydroxymethylglutaryl-CoA synthase n=1 Tax=Vagococcus silagei TaxID=2508885 RepID=A0A4S3B0Z4_9ENTE|nr:hydroxymethylglutaryl-CoA synthase [Vagococcus silagei]THB60691.1 hydroxymethylglutaryl-CoA synthase [Vagococcus silagei]